MAHPPPLKVAGSQSHKVAESKAKTRLFRTSSPARRAPPRLDHRSKTVKGKKESEPFAGMRANRKKPRQEIETCLLALPHPHPRPLRAQTSAAGALPSSDRSRIADDPLKERGYFSERRTISWAISARSPSRSSQSGFRRSESLIFSSRRFRTSFFGSRRSSVTKYLKS